MADFRSGLAGAGTGAAIGSFFPGPGTVIGAGIGFLGGLFGSPKKKNRSSKMLEERLRQLQDPSFMRAQFLDTARELAPSQSDILGRLRASGVRGGASSVLADVQFGSEQARARAAGARAFGQFQLGNQANIQNTLAQLTGSNQAQLQRRDSFFNEILGAGVGLLGQQIGSGQGLFGGGGGGGQV